ncbi:hypothetical protein A6409_11180 [Prescottella equi]|nr:hypothetical protein A6409_11180 [Prescottella equi]
MVSASALRTRSVSACPDTPPASTVRTRASSSSSAAAAARSVGAIPLSAPTSTTSSTMRAKPYSACTPALRDVGSSLVARKYVLPCRAFRVRHRR